MDGQAIKWLEILCNCLFEFTQSPTYNIEFRADFDFIEVQLFYKIIYLLFLFIADLKFHLQKYLRFQIYTTLKSNTTEWEKQQKKKLDNLKNSLLLSFQKILTDFSNESLSKEILKYVLI